MSEAYQKLIKTLRTVFEMDKADLDFGIYRILNQKREEITQFLNTDLLPQVKATFADYAAGGKSELEAELQQAIEQARTFGVAEPENTPPVLAIKAKLATAVDMVAVENEVYSHLHTFFSRYYDKGDFISQRRYKTDTYAIPYEGEEVKLYWANHDQYYIKSSERLRDYAFTLQGHDGKTVRIKLVEADTEKDNVKAKSDEERRFVLDDKQPLVVVDGDELHIRFRYVPTGKKTQDALNEEAVKTVFEQTTFKDWLVLLQAKAPTEKNPKRTVLEKHLNDYTARHTFDYFIHKDLGGFLRRELDFYIKNEVLHLDDIDDAAFAVTEQHLRKIKVIRTIALKLIRMLAQLEDFQKKLWLKKKFVVDTQYCITLDRVPEVLYPEIAANLAQHDEWVKLFAINEIKKDLENPGYAKPLTVDFLKANNKLVVDTRFFDERFKDRLLASIDDFDEQCDGLLIHSENFQALNLLQERQYGQVDYIYIDPPYNTNEASFIYKNLYKHSSWGSMLHESVALGKRLLNSKGVFSTAIDDLEQPLLSNICDKVFGFDNRLGNLVIEIKPSGRTNDNFFATSHEYLLFYGINPNDTKICFFQLTEEQKLQYAKTDEKGAHKWRDFLRTGGYSTPEERPNSFYPIFYNEKTGDISISEKYGFVKILPIDSEGKYRVWRKTPPSFMEHVESGEINITKNRNGQLKVQIIDRIKEGIRPKSVWIGKQYDAASHGTKLLKNIFGNTSLFSFPKSIYAVYNCVYVVTGDPEISYVVLDSFAGSGTTGHAVINLNREDGGQRKYILIEMADYFHTVLKPRIAKVVYSEAWKDGKPTSSNTGVSHCFKYLRLESYEDTLNNLILKDRTKPQQKLLNENPALREDYLLGYWLDVETADSPSLLNMDQFEDPFNYQLNIAAGSVGAFKPTRVDLVETFNYLIGLRVKHTDTLRGFKVVIGANPKGESVLIIWRNTKDKDNAALEAFLDKQKYNPRDTEFDHLYVNGDHTLDDPHSKVKMIEIEFKRLMFDTQGV